MGYNKHKRPALNTHSGLMADIRTSTSASTSLEPRGVWALVSGQTSSGSPDVYTLQNPKKGDRLELIALTIGSSSQAPIHVNSNAIFSFATGSTAHDMVTLATQGSAVTMIARSSSQWLVTGIRGATFSTST